MTRVLSLRLHTLILLLMHFKTKYQILKGKKNKYTFKLYVIKIDILIYNCFKHVTYTIKDKQYYLLDIDHLGTPVYIPDRCPFLGYIDDNESRGKIENNRGRIVLVLGNLWLNNNKLSEKEYVKQKITKIHAFWNSSIIINQPA